MCVLNGCKLKHLSQVMQTALLTAAGKFPRKIFVLDFIDLRRTQRKTQRSFQEFCCFIICILNDCKKASRNFKINLSVKSRFCQPRVLSGNSPLHFLYFDFLQESFGRGHSFGSRLFQPNELPRNFKTNKICRYFAD